MDDFCEKHGSLKYEISMDDYIVGDRVWVNGLKPGYIQYIGETHIAPGDWAGVVLDDRTGKNDGSVSGRRYFYCEPNRGIFCRLHRLTRLPIVRSSSPDRSKSPTGILKHFDSLRLDDDRRSRSPILYDMNMNRIRSKTPDAGRAQSPSKVKFNWQDSSLTSSRGSTPISGDRNLSRSSHYSLPKRPARTVTTVTETSTTIDGRYKTGPLRVGDKVFVNTSNGVHSGRLRYFGKVDFAPGLWAGVQLDEAKGKNDGTVAGKRYFKCTNFYGIFAPSYKVVKADPRRMTTITRITKSVPQKV